MLNKKIKDLLGKKFGRLTVVSISKERCQSRVIWNVICDCGRELAVVGTSLSNGHTTSCGCYKNELLSKRMFKDLTGKSFGKLKVISKGDLDKYGSYTWLCLCECGKTTFVSQMNLVKGNNKSCGCLSESYIAHALKIYYCEKYNAVSEYKAFKNPKTGRSLPFDIYIPEKRMFIEIHGEQHFSITRITNLRARQEGISPKEVLLYQKRLDKLKMQYAISNGKYISVDLRKIKTLEQAIPYINSFM